MVDLPFGLPSIPGVKLPSIPTSINPVDVLHKITQKDVPYTYDKDNHVLNTKASTKEGDIAVTVAEDGSKTTVQLKDGGITAGVDGSLSVTMPDGSVVAVKDPNMARAIAQIGRDSTNKTPEEQKNHEMPKLKYENAETLAHDASTVLSKAAKAAPGARSY